jgi:hypothetical protein
MTSAALRISRFSYVRIAKRESPSKKKKESSFLKKRSKKLLFLRQRQDPGHRLDHGSGGRTEVFCFFSSEKKIFLSILHTPDPAAPPPPPPAAHRGS